MNRQRTDGFTLLELLAVVIIMGVMLAVGIPAVTNLMKSTSLSAAARQVSSTLSLARQYAITQRSKTWVAFAYKDSTNPATSMWYNAYAVLLCTNRTAGAWQSAGAWQYLSKWEYLPEGAVFSGSGLPASLTSSGYIPNATNSAVSNLVAYIEFGPTGAAANTGSLSIFEGFISNGSPTNTSANYVYITFDNLIGRIKVTRP